METAKSMDWVRNLLSAIKTPPAVGSEGSGYAGREETACAIVKCFAAQNVKIKCATHAGRHITMRSISSLAKQTSRARKGTLSSKAQIAMQSELSCRVLTEKMQEQSLVSQGFAGF